MRGRDSFGGVMEWLRENILVQLEKKTILVY